MPKEESYPIKCKHLTSDEYYWRTSSLIDWTRTWTVFNRLWNEQEALFYLVFWSTETSAMHSRPNDDHGLYLRSLWGQGQETSIYSTSLSEHDRDEQDGSIMWFDACALHTRRRTLVFDNDPNDKISAQLFPSVSLLSSAYLVTPALAARCVTTLGQLCSMTFYLVAFLLNVTHDGSCWYLVGFIDCS